MKLFNSTLFLVFSIIIAQPALALIQVENHPLITPYPGSTVWQSTVKEFDRIRIPTGIVDFDKEKNDYAAASSILLEGKITAFDYHTPRERSGFEVLRNYEDGLKQGGFEILFSCLENECGRGKVLKKFLRTGISVGWPESGMLTARLARAEGDVYVVVGVNQKNGNSQLVVVEARPMETGLVKVDAEAMFKDIERTGHASIYGIYFDSGKAEVKPESREALAEIAKLLSGRPELNLYVVGHTDNVGALDYNRNLSRQRAAAVVKVLTDDYEIKADRLLPDGVGPLAPVAANTSDPGRAKNRRVELVAR